MKSEVRNIECKGTYTDESKLLRYPVAIEGVLTQSSPFSPHPAGDPSGRITFHTTPGRSLPTLAELAPADELPGVATWTDKDGAVRAPASVMPSTPCKDILLWTRKLMGTVYLSNDRLGNSLRETLDKFVVQRSTCYGNYSHTPQFLDIDT
jgi:hypothetical protein